MRDADLAFERSEVDATLTAPVLSIKNPYAGCIRVPSAGEISWTTRTPAPKSTSRKKNNKERRCDDL